MDSKVMNNAVRFIAPVAPEKGLAELVGTAGESIEQASRLLVSVARELLQQLKDAQTTSNNVSDETRITPIYMSVNQALERYGISRSTFYQICQLEGCPKLGKVGKKTIIPIATFDEFFSSLIMSEAGKEL